MKRNRETLKWHNSQNKACEMLDVSYVPISIIKTQPTYKNSRYLVYTEETNIYTCNSLFLSDFWSVVAPTHQSICKCHTFAYLGFESWQDTSPNKRLAECWTYITFQSKQSNVNQVFKHTYDVYVRINENRFNNVLISRYWRITMPNGAYETKHEMYVHVYKSHTIMQSLPPKKKNPISASSNG